MSFLFLPDLICFEKILFLQLIKNINSEQILNNQTAWIELWVKLYDGKSMKLTSWLNDTSIDPLVKEYGRSLIKNL